MSTPRIQSVDHVRLLQELAVHACKIMKSYGLNASATVLVDGIGKSARDFACDTLILFLEGEAKCPGDQAAVCAYLRRALERDIVDALRSSAARTTKKVQHVSGVPSEDGKQEVGLDDFPARDDTAATAEANLFKQRMYGLLETSEPELYELVYAVFEENALTPREIAAVIGCEADEVQNRKKRLRTFMAKHSIIEFPAKVSA